MGEEMRVYERLRRALSRFAFPASIWAAPDFRAEMALSSSAWLTARSATSGVKRFTSRSPLSNWFCALARVAWAWASAATYCWSSMVKRSFPFWTVEPSA